MKAIHAGILGALIPIVCGGGVFGYDALSSARHKNQEHAIQAAVVSEPRSPAMNNIGFAEAISKRQDSRWRAWHWYELTDGQYENLVAALKTLPEGDRKHVKVACSDADCRPLAEDMVDAFHEAGWDVELYGIAYQTQVGLWCSGIPACQAVTAATGIKTVPYDGPKDTVMLVFGPKK